ncbi:fumarylacetoacetate hydrolase family protein [Alisedimentitalea sp. MJ-SS2]|uniref:fumarylacetoacetate hydrolase family protein n=1 Tax=Aliisedimentitalea sp. MJ-SS2 TaxID=3049795 RepID=UPI00290E0E5D|nr:fumarylacetoacetate hydrolase family protein [Alisedimentitalea sp. MJ-SS2]MDU8927234.1 fumarylacetoacetate hydrolase family protein [Alisedimentitalea sp. MJ-SS2]
MSDYLFELPEIFSIPVLGLSARYPVRRIFCVGRNYAAHAAEMGGEVDREAPWYFTKSAAHAVGSDTVRPYPPGTQNYHHEMELAFAIGTPVFRASPVQAAEAIYAYGCGLDMTRRDRQQDGKDHRRPWSLGKDVEDAAVLAPMTRAGDFGPIRDQRIHLEVNGEIRQDATLAEMVWSCEEVVAHLSQFYHLAPGDVILSGTPAGVGPVQAGDRITGGIDGLEPISLELSAAE